MATETRKDVLLIISAAGRDEEWEKRILNKIGGQVDIRWQALSKPDGSFKRIDEFEEGLFDGVTMLYTYSPIPVGR